MDDYIDTILQTGDETGVGDALVKRKVVDAEVFKKRRKFAKRNS